MEPGIPIVKSRVYADPTLDDEASLAGRAGQDRQAFAALYDRYFARVYNYMRYRCHEAQTADDLTAQVFERALANIGAYRAEKAPFGAWLFAIARNALNDHLRRQRRQRWLSLDFLGGRGAAEGERAPEERLIATQSRQALLDALAHLGERERDLVALKFAAGLNNRQIAGLTGLSESNVGVIVYRALHRLRALLGDRPPVEDETDERA